MFPIMNCKAKTWTAVLLSFVLILGLLGCTAVNSVEKAESPQPMSAQEAMDALKNSLTFSQEGDKVKLTFTIPDCKNALDFRIRINGHETAGAKVFYYDEYNGKWAAKNNFSFHRDDWSAFTDLIFTADLDGAEPLEVDILTCYRQTYDVTLFEKYGLTVAIPNEYIDRLLVFTEPKYKQHESSFLISVYEKQSYEESRADWGGEDGGGYLFGICRYTQAQYESYLCSDGSGLSFFAKDDTYYYGHTFATDVQFYRSGIKSYEEDVFAPWTELTEQVDGILGDFITRNGLTTYSDNEFWNRDFTYDGEHRYVTYYPYYAVNGSRNSSYTLVLSQPAKRGEGGIWCVERWYDNDYGNLYYYFPSWNNSTGLGAAEYYARLQTECDNGHRPGLLDPVQAAMEFATEHFGHTPVLDSFTVIDGEPAGSVLRLCNQVFDDMGTLQAAALSSDGTHMELDKQEIPDYYDMPFSSYTGSGLYPIIWLHAEEPTSLSGNVVYCRNADETKLLAFYEQDSLLSVNVDGTKQWFKPAYSYDRSPYDRMFSFYEEFSTYDNDASRHSYSNTEIQAASDVVYALFESGFEGCTLTELTYDPARSYEAAQGYIKNGRGSINDSAIDNVIVLYGSFITDGNQTVLNPNSTYDNYMFILIRDNADSAWIVDDGGY